MKCLSKFTALACALALSPVHAGEGMNSSEASVLMTSSVVSMVVAAPFVFVSEGAQKLADASTGSNPTGPKSRRSAGDNIPEMEVKEIGEDENGDLRVHLQRPDTPEHTIALTWRGHEDTPAAGFREGALIAFQPSPQTSGWLLRDDTGTALGFIPVADSAAEQHSTLF